MEKRKERYDAWANVLGLQPHGTEETLVVYCIDIRTPLDTESPYAEGEWEESEVANLEAGPLGPVQRPPQHRRRRPHRGLRRRGEPGVVRRKDRRGRLRGHPGRRLALHRRLGPVERQPRQGRQRAARTRPSSRSTSTSPRTPGACPTPRNSPWTSKAKRPRPMRTGGSGRTRSAPTPDPSNSPPKAGSLETEDGDAGREPRGRRGVLDRPRRRRERDHRLRHRRLRPPGRPGLPGHHRRIALGRRGQPGRVRRLAEAHPRAAARRRSPRRMAASPSTRPARRPPNPAAASSPPPA